MPAKKQQVQPAESSQKREPSQPKKATKKEAPVEEMKTSEPKSPLAKKRMSLQPQDKSAKKPAKEDKNEESKKDAKSTKPIKSALPPKDLGPEPKNAKSAYNFFNTAHCSELKAGNAELKQSDCFKLAGEKWGTMSDEDKKIYNQMAEKDKALHEKRVQQREKHGYFTFEDGSKSTDEKNKDNVKKEVKSKAKLAKEHDSSDEEQVLQPPKVLSSYTLFMKHFQPPEGTANLDRMKLAGKAWADCDEKAKQKYVDLSKEDEQRREAQLAEMKKQGWFTMADGSKSSDHKPKKKKSGKIAKRDVSGDESDEAKAKPVRKPAVVTKPKQQPMTKKPELNIESSEITEKTPITAAAKEQAPSGKSIKPKANGGKKQYKLEAE